jgi:hypothetical protein
MTGGYNFQSAWTSGYIAGSSAGYDISRWICKQLRKII